MLTGGTALIDGIQELGEQIFNLPTRVGFPIRVGGLKDVVNSPMYATAVGLLMYGADKEGVEKRFRIRSDEKVFKPHPGPHAQVVRGCEVGIGTKGTPYVDSGGFVTRPRRGKHGTV